MRMRVSCLAFIVGLSSPAFAQTTNDPFPTPLTTTDAVVSVNFTKFATIPDAAAGEAPRMNPLVDEPGTKCLFEVFYVDADNPPKGGQDPTRRILFNDKGTSKPLLQLIRDKNTAQGKPPAPRADLRLGARSARTAAGAQQARWSHQADRAVRR